MYVFWVGTLAQYIIGQLGEFTGTNDGIGRKYGLNIRGSIQKHLLTYI